MLFFFTLEGSETIGDIVLSFLVIVSNVVFVLTCGYLGCQKFDEKNQLTKKMCQLFSFFPRLGGHREDEEKSNDAPSQTMMPRVELSNFRMKEQRSEESEESVVIISDDLLPLETASETASDVEDFLKLKETDENGKMQWIQHEDNTGTPYYENTNSGRTTWTQRDSSGQLLNGADVDDYIANPMKK